MTVEYREFAVGASLAHAIECVWTLSGTVADAGADRLLPDGCTELILNFGDPVYQHFDESVRVMQPDALVVGQMRGPVEVEFTGRVSLCGVRFHPAGLASLVDTPAWELADRTLPIADVSSRLARMVADAAATGNPAADLPRVLAVLEHESTRLNRADPVVDALVKRLIQSNGQQRISTLGEISGLSVRQLERRFLSRVGLTPKRLARVLRFQRVFDILNRVPAERWSAIAARCGYHDQAHLITDFREFAGAAPAALLEQDLALTRNFTRANRMSHSYNPAE